MDSFVDEKFDINQMFKLYKANICTKQEETTFLSMLSLVFDSVTFLVIKNIIFQLDNSTINYCYPYLIKLSALLQYEMCIYWDDINAVTGGYKQPSPEFFEQLKSMRKKIHQFEYKRHYFERKKCLHNEMGTSTDIKKPMVDFCVFFEKNSKLQFGTSHSFYDVYNKKNDFKNNKIFCSAVDLFKQNIKLFNVDIIKNVFKTRVNRSFIIRNYPYSYLKAKNDFQIQNKMLLDRFLEIYNDLGYVISLCNHIADFNYCDDYILLSLSKFISIALDESIDNLDRYIKFASDNDKKIINKIRDNINIDAINYAKCLRNNIHYKIQTYNFDLNIVCKVYRLLIEESNKLHNLINTMLKFNSKSFSAKIYKLVAWSKYGYKDN